MWTPEPSEELLEELRQALARPGASWVNPPKPVAHVDGTSGWLWGRRRTEDGSWLGLVTLYRGYFWEGAELGWHRAEDLRVLNE